jgi:hypothetical protein
VIRRGFEVGPARVGVSCNAPALLESRRFFWLDTNFKPVMRIPFSEAKDSRMEIWEGGAGPTLEFEGRTLVLRGSFIQLQGEARDPRYSIFGNLGIFSTWVLRTLEDARGVHTLHACGLVRDGRLLIVSGGAGSGKSVFLLSALDRGWRLFATEFVHFQARKDLVFFKGSLKDTVRVETFRDFFPEWPRRLGLELEAEVGGKLAVDLSAYQADGDRLENPELNIVFPHVEERRARILSGEIEDEEELRRRLFAGATEKIEKGILLYGRLAVPGFDDLSLGKRRAAAVERLMESGRLRRALSWVSGVEDAHRIFDRLET